MPKNIYYETFKNELSDSDFSECKILELSDEEPEEEPEEKEEIKFETIEEVFIEFYEDEDEKPAELVENVNEKNEQQQSLQPSKKRGRPTKNTKLSSVISSVAKPKKIFSQQLHKPPPKKQKTSPFQCQRCLKEFYQKSFHDQHTAAQCDRHRVFMERQSLRRGQCNQ